MELTVPLIKTKISGDVERKAYTADAQTISDLSLLVSSKIYTDNVMAVIREISCNAYDANLDSNSIIPFKVTLPCCSQGGSPFIEWRDYGLGLSEADVNSIFTNLVRSTKRDKKNPIGCFGVGSKSPFSYCNNFSISSYQDGSVTHYSMQKDSSGFSFFKMGSSTTEELNGLKVKVPVKYRDIEEFRSKAIHYFSLWKEKDLPIIENLSGVKIKFRLENIFEFDGFCVYKNNKDCYDFTVLMGNVLYSVNRSELESEIKDISLSSYSGITIEVPLGYFSPAISRESLDYNEYTFSQFKKFFDLTKDKVSKFLRENIDSYPNFKSAYDSTALFRSLGLVNESLEYKGFDLMSKASFQERAWPLYIEKFKNNIIGPPPNNDAFVDRKEYCFKIQEVRKTYTTKRVVLKNPYFEDSYLFSINSQRRHCFYLMDCEFKYKKDYTSFFLFLSSRFNIYDFVIFNDVHKPIIEKVKKYYGAENVRIRSINKIYKRLLEEYEKSKKTKNKSSTKKVFSGVETLDLLKKEESVCWIKNESVDLSLGGFYLNTKVNEYNKAQAFKIRSLILFINLVDPSIKVPIVYGFKHKCLISKSFKENEDKWISEDKIIDSLFKILKSNDDIFYCAHFFMNKSVIRDFFKNDYDFLQVLSKKINDILAANPKDAEKYKKIRSICNIASRVKNIYYFFVALNLPIDDFKPENPRQVEISKIIKGSYFKTDVLRFLVDRKDYIIQSIFYLERLDSEDLSLTLIQRVLDKIK